MSYRPVQHHPRPCLHCGTPYTPRRSDGKYCSSSCCSQANYLVNPRTKKGDTQPEEPKPKETKEVSFTKLAAAAAVGQAVVEVIENVADIGNAARLSRIEKQNQRILQKLEGSPKETRNEVAGPNLLLGLPNPTPDLTLLPAAPSTPLPGQLPRQRNTNSFSKYGPQFDAKDIIM